MNFIFTFYSIPLAVSAAFVLMLGIFALGRLKIPGAKGFLASMAMGFIWSVTNMLEMAGSDLPTKLFWANLQYIAYAFAPVAWIAMVLEFAQQKIKKRRRFLAVACIIPVLTVVIAWLDVHTGFMRSNFSLENGPFFSVIGKDYGPWWYVQIIHAYLLNFYSIYMLAKIVISRNTLYRRQAVFLLVGHGVIIMFSLVYIFQIGPITEFDMAPVSFSISAVIIAYGIFRNSLFRTVPLARAELVEQIPMAVIVYDSNGKALDVNTRAESIIGSPRSAILGEKISDLIISEDLRELLQRPPAGGYTSVEIHIDVADKQETFEVFSYSLETNGLPSKPRVLALHEITNIRKAAEKIRRQEDELLVLEDRERLARELHDDLGQNLSFAAIQNQSIQRELQRGNTETAMEQIMRLQQILDSNYADVRKYVFDIRDAGEKHLHFIDQLRELADKVLTDLKIPVELDIPGILEPRFQDNPVRHNLLKICQEAINNAAKHSTADAIKISAVEQPDGVDFLIRDNGSGVSPDAMDRKNGSGLMIMRERALLCGAGFSIQSEGGTCIRIHFPPSTIPELL